MGRVLQNTAHKHTATLLRIMELTHIASQWLQHAALKMNKKFKAVIYIVRNWLQF